MTTHIYQRKASSLFATSLILWLVGLFLCAALINGTRELTVLCLLVLVLAATLRVWTSVSFRRSEYALTVNRRRLFAGESLVLTMTVTNRSILPTSYEVHAPIGLLSLPGGGEAVGGEAGPLWLQSTSMRWDLAANHRGVHTIGPVTVASGDVLGFYVKEFGQKEELEVIVYPRLVPLLPFTIPRRDFFGIPGGESPVDDPVYVLGTIDYHYGKPAKHIHWKASARHHRLQQKVFEPTDQEKVLILIDTQSFDGGNRQAFEETLEVVASLAAQLDRRGCAVGLVTNGRVEGGSPIVPVTRSPYQMPAILETLARLSDVTVSAMTDTVTRIGLTWGTTCLYFCYERTEATDLARLHIGRHRMPFVALPYNATVRLREESDTARGGRRGQDPEARQAVAP